MENKIKELEVLLGKIYARQAENQEDIKEIAFQLKWLQAQLELKNIIERTPL
jgi:DnaJ-domain-containing protein 1